MYTLSSPRDLSDAERNILEYILSADVIGAKELRAQVPFVKVAALWEKDSPSVDFVRTKNVPKTPLTSRVFPVEAEVHDKNGAVVGGIVIWVEAGYVSSLEYWWTTDDPPTELPGINMLRLA